MPARIREWWRERRTWEISEETRANSRKLRALVVAREAASLNDEARTMLNAAKNALGEADRILKFEAHHRKPLSSHSSSAQIHINAARLLWMKSFISEPAKLSPYAPSLKAVIREHLPASDARCKSLDEIKNGLTPDTLVFLTEAVEAAQSVALHERMRALSFVRIVCGVAMFLLFLAVGVAVLTFFWPTSVPLCFNPIKVVGVGEKVPFVDYTVVCPTRSNDFPTSHDLDKNFGVVATWGDYVVVELVGLVAAGIAAASALRKLRGTSTPFPIPVALAALKLPAGALTAVLGLLLMRGGFVPGLSALDSSAQIIAWAIIWGYSQELFTKLVDKQGQMVLDAVRGPSSPSPGGEVSLTGGV